MAKRKSDSKKEQFTRTFDLQRDAIETENRTVSLAFASETREVQRHFGIEVLDHDAQSIRLDRLKNRAPLLVDHDMTDQVGVVESVSIGSDRVARAVVRFGKSARADEIFNDVVDGIRSKVSVGYWTHDREDTGETVGDVPVWRVTDWQPYEISIVSVAADDQLSGVGRDADQIQPSKEKKIMTTETQAPAQPEDATRAAPVIDVSAQVEKATKAEMSRIDTIRKMGEKFECDDLARDFIDSKKTVDEMRSAILEKVAERQQNTAPVTQLGMSASETREYSLLRAVRAAVTDDWSKAGLEREASMAIADSLGREARGFYVPFEVQSRVMTVGTDTAGGFLKGTDHLAGSFIDLLRAEALAGKLNARFLEGLTGDVDIPRLDGGATFGWVTEDADGTLSDATMGQILLQPKTVAGAVPISRRLLKQSAPSIEAMLMDDMAKGAALAIDLAVFEGSGAAGQPTGIVNTTGVATSTVADITNGIPTHAELVEFETDVATANGLKGTLAYVTTAGVRGGMKTTALDAGSGQFLYQNGEANGYMVEVSTQLTAQRIVFGNFEDVIIGMWGVLDVLPDKATKAASGGLVMRVFQDVDVGIRHAGSFCIDA